jgi:hypothetical protein
MEGGKDHLPFGLGSVGASRCLELPRVRLGGASGTGGFYPALEGEGMRMRRLGPRQR